MRMEQRDAWHTSALPCPHISHEPTSLVPTTGKKLEPQCCGTQLPAGRQEAPATPGPEQQRGRRQEGSSCAGRTSICFPGPASSPPLPSAPVPRPSSAGAAPAAPPFASHTEPSGSPASLRRAGSEGSAGRGPATHFRGNGAQETAQGTGEEPALSSLSLPGANEISHRHKPLNTPTLQREPLKQIPSVLSPPSTGTGGSGRSRTAPTCSRELRRGNWLRQQDSECSTAAVSKVQRVTRHSP